MRKKLTQIIALATFALISADSIAQVTIGSNTEVVDGALLQLKENENIEANAGKGLGLPRVSLTSKTNLYPMFEDQDAYKNNADNLKNTEDNKHIGLIVYNVNTDICEEIYPGTYVWDGTEWKALNNEKFPGTTDTLIDSRDPSKIEYYKIGKFEDAGWWMLENLRAERWPDGTSDGIYKEAPKENNETRLRDALLWYPNLDSSILTYKPHYGYVYNWYAASKLTQSDLGSGMNTDKIQGICPDGWHIPTKAEWLELSNVIYNNPCQYAHSKININTGYNMQSMEDAKKGVSRTSEQGGFNANMTGSVIFNNNTDKMAVEASYFGQRAYFWVSDTSSPTLYAKSCMALDADTYAIATFPQTYVAQISVRCKKNTTTKSTKSETPNRYADPINLPE